MTAPAPRPATRRRAPLRRAGAVVALAALLGGCSSGPSYDPQMPGIPEARAGATADLEAAMAQVRFSDRVTVLAEGRADACATELSDEFFAEAVGYHCSTAWMAAVVVPGATTREEVAGAVDDELRAIGVTGASTLAEQLVMLYPSVRAGATLLAGGALGDVDLRVEASPFRAATWRAPRIPRGAAEVSHDGDLEQLDAAAVSATGATEVVTVELSSTYWDTTGRYTDDRPRGSGGVWLDDFAEGPVYAFDIALPEPADAALACSGDPAVDPATVVSVQDPFPRLTFALRAEATSDDMQRVRGCLTAGLRSGAVALLTPSE